MIKHSSCQTSMSYRFVIEVLISFIVLMSWRWLKILSGRVQKSCGWESEDLSRLRRQARICCLLGQKICKSGMLWILEEIFAFLNTRNASWMELDRRPGEITS